MATTGLQVDLGSGDHPVVYRADMDALPIQDIKQRGHAPCVSAVPGVSHACGHDLHSAVAAGLCGALHAMEHELPGPIRIVFQPAEEVRPSGAAALVKDGALSGMRAAFALHCDPARDTGTVGLKTGPLTATADCYTIEVIGEAGHSARPHLARDALLASSSVIQAIYNLGTQRIDPLEPAVINLGMVSGGHAENVICGRVHLSGVVRTLLPDTRERIHQEIRKTAEAAAAVYGCSAEVRFRVGSPPIVNDERLDSMVRSAALDVLGPGGIQQIPKPSTGAEDFGEFSGLAPTYMMRLGVREPGRPTHHLHTAAFNLDEEAIAPAMRIMGRALLQAATPEALR